MNTAKVVAYYRVSTQRQGESGLGLEAQRASVAAYTSGHGYEMLAEYTEVETGKRDSLENRPELQKALAHAARSRATLVIAKLDRLTRSVYVTAELHRSGVDFVCCDNPYANRLTIQILAAVAEHEALMISQRTKAALAAYKARGGKLGAALGKCRNLRQRDRRRGAAKSAAIARAKADAAYVDILPDMQRMSEEGLSYSAIAASLTAAGHTTRKGKPWNPTQVWRVLNRAA